MTSVLTFVKLLALLKISAQAYWANDFKDRFGFPSGMIRGFVQA